jgi:hypothetical protein
MQVARSLTWQLYTTGISADMKLRYLVVCSILLLAAAPVTVKTAGEKVHWNCTPAFLPEVRLADAKDANQGEAISYLYIGAKDLHQDYVAQAKFISPIDVKSDWYDSGLRLGPLRENNGFAQLEVSHWRRFDYKGHIAVSWQLPNTSDVQYRDTGLMARDGASVVLGISVKGDTLHMRVNGVDICSTRAGQFVSAKDAKYFQVRTETAALGHNSGARVAAVALKRDSDTKLNPFQTNCVLHRFGIYWEPLSGSAFTARGSFYPTEDSFFTGLQPASRCKT